MHLSRIRCSYVEAIERKVAMLFSFLPIQRMHWHFVAITNDVINCIRRENAARLLYNHIIYVNQKRKLLEREKSRGLRNNLITIYEIAFTAM